MKFIGLLSCIFFYNGLSGKKSLGEHSKIFANWLRCLILYLAFLDGASISEIKVVLFPIAKDKATWLIPFFSLISFTFLITKCSISSSDSCILTK